MKNHLLLLGTFVVLALSACNQHQGPNPAASQAAAAPVAPKPWEPIPYDDKATVLPGLPGNDAQKFFSLFKERTTAAAKGEFETTEQFKARIANADSILAPLSVTKKYGFFTRGRLEYDADKQLFKSFSGEWCSNGYPFDDLISCQLGSYTETQDNYVGSNAFGATATVDRERGEDYYLLFSRKSKSARALKDKENYFLPIKCPVPVEKAKQVKDTISVLVVGRIEKPEWVRGLARIEDATVQNPREAYYQSYGIPFALTEIVCYVRTTGEILHVEHY
jgi:hypothetical protein